MFLTCFFIKKDKGVCKSYNNIADINHRQWAKQNKQENAGTFWNRSEPLETLCKRTQFFKSVVFRCWLKVILKKDISLSKSDTSVRRFESFGFIEYKQIADDDESNSNYIWKEVSIPSLSDASAYVRFYTNQMNLEQLNGFNNTGNVCKLLKKKSIFSFGFYLKKNVNFPNTKVCGHPKR